MPTLGTALVITFAVANTFVKKVLSYKPLVATGLISYSLYLWHYPLFSFARIRSIGPVEDWIYTGLLVCSFLLAYLTWRYIEMPFRDKHKISTRQLIFSLFAMAFVTLASSYFLSNFLNFNLRYSEKEMAAIQTSSSPSHNCDWVPMSSNYQERTMCFFGDVTASKRVILYGDSHASTLLSSLNDSFLLKGIKGIFILSNRDTTCMVVPFLYNDHSSAESVKYCSIWNEDFLKVIKTISPDHLILAARWTYQLYPVPKHIENQYFDNGEGGIEVDKINKSFAFENKKFVVEEHAKSNAVRRFIKGIAETNVPLIITYPVPEMGWNIPNRNFKLLLSGQSIPDVISVSYDLYKQRNMFSHWVLDS